MQLNKVDLNLFLVFDVIYRERNLTKAAEALHITQPAVSNSLSRLREVFNDRLFIRRSGNMVPTPLAENIVERVRAALMQLESSLNEHDDFDPATSTRKFTFAMNDTSETYVLPLLMEYLQREAKGISIESYSIPRNELAREFAAGQIDFALDVPLINEPQLTHHPLVQDHFVCIARDGHPEIKNELTMELYLKLPHIHVSSRRKGQGLIDMVLNRRGLKRNITLRVQHSRAAPPIVQKTNMLLTIPETLAREHKVQIFELPFAIPPVDWHLYWSSNYGNDRAHRWMREVIFSIFRYGCVPEGHRILVDEEEDKE